MGASHTYRYIKVPDKPTMPETLLWSNPSPTSSFAVQNVTLSESITNFNYIRIVARFSTSDATQTWAMYKTSDILAWGNGNSSSVAKPHGALNGRQSGWALRNISYRDSTIRFGSASLGASENNAYMIPIAIYGLKYVTSGGISQKGSAGTFTASTTTATHVNVGFEPSYLMITTQSGPYGVVWIYVKALSTTKYWYHSTNVSGSTYAFSTSTGNLASIDIDGFTIAKVVTSGQTSLYYVAVE